jgi:hypothetical protein
MRDRNLEGYCRSVEGGRQLDERLEPVHVKMKARSDREKTAIMISRMTTWLKNRLGAEGTRLRLDTKSSETGLAALIGGGLGDEHSAGMASAIAGLERGVPERELRAIHGEELYAKAEAQYRHQKRITGIITEIGNECDRQARREAGKERHDTRVNVLEQSRAAAAFAAAGPLTGSKDKALPKEVLWPWPTEEFRPHDARRNLVVVGAHLIAAIERLDRVGAREAAMQAESREAGDDGMIDGAPSGPPPLLFVRNHGMQADSLLHGLSWLIHQPGPVLHIVANSPENLFDVFKKMATSQQDGQIAKMFVDLAHGLHIAGNEAEIQPIIASQHLDEIDRQAPLLLLYPSLETLEWLAEEHGRTAAPWLVLPWDWEELAEWLEDQEAEEAVVE